MPAAKRTPRRGAKRAAKGKPENPFDRREQPDLYAVAKLLLQKGAHSWTELKESTPSGTFSPRNMNIVLRDLEAQGARFVKFHAEGFGTCYELDPEGEPLATDGYDAKKARGMNVKRQSHVNSAPAKKTTTKKVAKKAPARRGGRAAAAPAKKAPAKRAPARKTAAAKKAAPAPKRQARKAAPAKKVASRRPAAKKTAANAVKVRPRPRSRR